MHAPGLQQQHAMCRPVCCSHSLEISVELHAGRRAAVQRLYADAPAEHVVIRQRHLLQLSDSGGACAEAA